jgi:CRISPR/Cas system-associated endonuclease Cas1
MDTSSVLEVVTLLLVLFYIVYDNNTKCKRLNDALNRTLKDLTQTTNNSSKNREIGEWFQENQEAFLEEIMSEISQNLNHEKINEFEKELKEYLRLMTLAIFGERDSGLLAHQSNLESDQIKKMLTAFELLRRKIKNMDSFTNSQKEILLEKIEKLLSKFSKDSKG